MPETRLLMLPHLPVSKIPQVLVKALWKQYVSMKSLSFPHTGVLEKAENDGVLEPPSQL